MKEASSEDNVAFRGAVHNQCLCPGSSAGPAEAFGVRWQAQRDTALGARGARGEPSCPPNAVSPLRLAVAFQILAVALLVGCSKESNEAKEAKEGGAAEKSAEAPSHVKRGTNGQVVITLDAGTQKIMGLQTASLEAAHLSPEVKGYGHVLDVSPLTSLVTDVTAARAASQASQAELKRVKALAAQNNASERALQTAEANAARDQAQAESARLRLLAGWGSVIAGRDDLPAFIEALGSLSNALVQIDLPAGEPLPALPTGARLVTLADGAQPTGAQLLGPAPAVDPQMQGRSLLFLVSPNPLRLAPGAAVTAYLTLPGEGQAGVTLPRNAIVRFNGTTWVYRQISEDSFERIEVTLDSPLENGWFVHEGLKPADKVVATGAQQLLSDELKEQLGE